MRHGNKNNPLSRKKGHRTALMKNMSASLIMHKRIVTTLPKAKVLRQYIEPLVTKAVRASKMETAAASTHQRRLVFSQLQNKFAVHELFTNVAAQVGDRPGGYTRIIRTGFRKGDGAEMAMIEFVDYNTVYGGASVGTEESQAKKTRRSRRKKSGDAAVAAVAATAATSALAGETTVTETRHIHETLQGEDQELLGLEETTEEDATDRQ